MFQANLVEIRILKKFSVSFYILGCRLNEISSSSGLNVATGTSARCRSNAMNEKFRNFDTHLRGIFYRAIKKKTCVQIL